MHKLLAMGASVAMLFSVSTPAFATYTWPTPTPVTTNTNNITFTGNGLHVYGNTGMNKGVGGVGTGVISGMAFGSVSNSGGLSQGITTGEAIAQGQQIVQLSPTGCDGCQTTLNNVTFGNNHLSVKANTGKNVLLGGVVTGTYHASTGGVSNTGGTSQGVTTGGVQALGNQWVITGVTATPSTP